MPEACKVLDIHDYMKLPTGTLIHGTVTVGEQKINVEVTVGEGSPSLTAEEHLCVIQGELNGSADIDDAIARKGVTVTKYEIPDRELPKKILSGTYWRTLNEKSQNPINDGRKVIKKILNFLGIQE